MKRVIGDSSSLDLSRMSLWLATFLLVGTLSPLVSAQDRPDENAMFGGENASPTPGQGGDSDLLGDKLQIGGDFYQRLVISPQESVSESETPLSMPLQFDLFFDSRPGDRLRGFVNNRLSYDSTKDQYSQATSGNTFSSLPSVSATTPVPNNPHTALDQAWLKFDVDRTVFVTAGKQHVKWGTSRFWNPTDFLSSQRRDPLAPVDSRLGSTMLKFELPLEAAETNFYGIFLFDNPRPASTLGGLSGAFRVEKVLGETEIGLDLLGRGSRTPSYGADISSSLGPVDVYVESAVYTSAPGSRYELVMEPTAGADLSTLMSSHTPSGAFVQTSGGMNYSFAWTDNRLATVGIEYFHNQLGYSNGNVYPVLIFLGEFQPFYVGRDYAAFYMTAEGPDAQKKTNYTFSTLSNLSDKSLVSRLDFSVRALTHLTFEAFASIHGGSRGGEFNFALDTPDLTYQSQNISAIHLPRTVYDVGMGLKLAF